MSHLSLRKLAAPASALTLALVSLFGCADGANCSISTNDDGEPELRCLDGSVFVIPDGNTGDAGERGGPGAPGRETTPCALTTNDDGSRTLTCGDTSVTLDRESVDCEDGFPGSLHLQSEDSSNRQTGAPSSLFLFELTDCERLQGDLVIEGYQEATLPPSLDVLKHIDGELRIGEYNGLDNIGLTTPVFANLQTVGGVVLVVNNPNLTSLDAFPALESARRIIIEENPALANVGDFPHLRHAASIEIAENPNLTRIRDFPELLETQTIRVTGNPNLGRIGSFSALATLGALEISAQGQQALYDLGRYPSLKTLNGALNISEFGSPLREMPEFPVLEHAESFSIRNNLGLEHIPDFPLLKLPEDADLTIDFNWELRTIGSFSALTTLRDIWIAANDNLVSIGSFSALEEVVHLRINHSDLLDAIGDFPELHTVSWNLDIRNVGITALPRFPKLTEIGTIQPPEGLEGLNFLENPSLSDVSGFEVLGLIVGNLTVTDNPSLSQAQVNTLISVHDQTTGPRVISGNGP